jgi:hypothetical protein
MTRTTPTPEGPPLDDAAPDRAAPFDDAASSGDVPTGSESGDVPQAAGRGSGAGWRTRLARHPIATGAVAATLAAGLAFGGGMLAGRATASPAPSGWADRSGLPITPPDGKAGSDRGGPDRGGPDRGAAPRGADGGTTRGGSGSTTGPDT